MKVVITGGAGFIGSHIGALGHTRGHEMTVFDNFSSGHLRNVDAIGEGVQVIRGDVRDRAALEQAFVGASVVFHQAAIVSVPYSVEHPEETCAVNIGGTLNVLLAAKACGVRRVVLASSAAVYGDEPTLPKRESMLPAPISPYGLEKLTLEHYAAVFAGLYGIETVALRYFNVFGPRQDPKSPYSGVISIFAERISRGEAITFLGDGNQTRDFVYVANVAEANWLAAETEGASGQVFNIAGGQETTLRDIATMLEAAYGKTVEKTHAAPRAGDIKASLADITKAKTLLGYHPQIDVQQGLRHLVESA